MKSEQVLTLDAVAAAVRAQGLGLLQAAVNAAFQFLGSKITALSQVGLGFRHHWTDVEAGMS